jgi:integrase
MDGYPTHEMSPPPLVSSFLADWLAFVETRVRRVTFETYRSHLQLHVMPRLGNRHLDTIGPLDLQGLYAELLGTRRQRGAATLSATTVVHVHRVLSEAFRQGVRWGLLSTNPAAGATPPRARRPQTALVDVAIACEILNASAGTNMHLAVALALGTGMRRGEILGLTWPDIDLASAVLHVSRTLHITQAGLVMEEPKTRKSRRPIALPRFIVNILLGEWHDPLSVPILVAGAPYDIVVRTPSGQAWNPDTFSSSWRRLARRIGLTSVRFHDLRHAHATLMLVKGIHPKIVSERLGHSNIGITLDTYSHVLPSMQIQAAEALDELLGQTPD